MSKRQKVVLAALAGGAVVFVAMMTSLVSGLVEIVVIVGVVSLLSRWVLGPGLSWEEHLTVLTLPMLLAGGVALLAERPNLLIPWKYFLPPGFGIGSVSDFGGRDSGGDKFLAGTSTCLRVGLDDDYIFFDWDGAAQLAGEFG